jgi:hypothetical protein
MNLLDYKSMIFFFSFTDNGQYVQAFTSDPYSNLNGDVVKVSKEEYGENSTGSLLHLTLI